jgi:predicted acyl esterase
MSYREVSETRDEMRIDWDMPITMDDGLVLRCDVYRPIRKGRYPVILSGGPYGKWLHFEDGYKTAWKRMEEKAGRSATPRNGYPKAMSACASIHAAAVVRPAM